MFQNLIQSSKTIINRPKMSLQNSRELKHKLPKWWTNYKRKTRRDHKSKCLRPANHNQSKICQELKKRTSNPKKVKSSRRSSSQREPSGTPKGSGKLSMPRGTLSLFKRPSTPTVMMKSMTQTAIETRESRLWSISSSENKLLC